MNERFSEKVGTLRERERKKERGRQTESKRQTRCLVSESSNPVEV